MGKRCQKCYPFDDWMNLFFFEFYANEQQPLQKNLKITFAQDLNMVALQKYYAAQYFMG